MDCIFPDWLVMDQFINEVYGLAQNLGSLASSHEGRSFACSSRPSARRRFGAACSTICTIMHTRTPRQRGQQLLQEARNVNTSQKLKRAQC